MENKNTNTQNRDVKQTTPPIRTLKDDIAKAMGEGRPSASIPSTSAESKIPLPPPPKKPQEIPQNNPFVRSDILAFTDRETPPIPKKTAFEISPIRTYTGDVAEVVRKGNTSLIQIAVAEQKHKEEKQEMEEIDRGVKRKNIFMIIGSIVFILLGAGIFYYVTFIEKSETKVEVAEKIQLIITESTEEIIFDGDRDVLIKALNTALTASLPQSSMKSIAVKNQNTAEMLPALEFLSLIAPSIPSFLLRSLSPEYVFGVYSKDGQQSFIILKIDSYENAFAGMLKWESEMRRDLGKLFLNGGDQSSSLPKTPTSVLSSGFEDSVIKNKDVRLIRNSNGESILLYGFVNRGILIVTTTPQAFEELNERLRRAQIVR